MVGVAVLVGVLLGVGVLVGVSLGVGVLLGVGVMLGVSVGVGLGARGGRAQVRSVNAWEMQTCWPEAPRSIPEARS